MPIREERLRRLARRIEETAKKDQLRAQQARTLAALRSQAAEALWRTCDELVQQVNAFLQHPTLELAPPEYKPESFRDPGVNLFQLNARGRIVQLVFESTGEQQSTERIKTPYILAGAVRSFNQELLESQGIYENPLFYCLERPVNVWRVFDSRTHNSSLLDADYLTGALERLL